MAQWKAEGRYPGIFRDENDATHWRLVVNLGRAGTGESRRRAVKVLHGTLTEARAAHTELQGQRDKLQIMPQAEKAPRTVDEWFTVWLEKYKRRDVERSTFARYENSLRIYISPRIGKAKLRRLRPEDIQDFTNSLRDAGLAPGSVFQVVALLRQALRKAVALGIIARDPLMGEKMPTRPGRRHLRVPSDEELRALLDTMVAADASAYPLTRMALATGLREGELIPLEWSSVDLKKGSVYVCRTVARVPAEGPRARYYELEFKEDTKTPDSTNTVPLDPLTLAWLKEHRKTVAEAKMLLRPKHWTDRDGDLVFPCLSTFAGSPAGRAWLAGSLRPAFHNYADKVGLGYLRFHDLRHIFGAVLHRNGVPLLTISRLMRHKNIRTTADTYGHVGAEELGAAVDTLASLWGAR